MTGSLFQTATANFSETFSRAPIRARHSLHEIPLFDDEALARLIESHPRELTDIHAPRGESRDAKDFPVIDVEQTSGAALLNEVRNGRIWINLRRAMNETPEYKAVLDTIVAELKVASTNFQPRQVSAGILISSPTASVPYHCDKTDVLLWHVRGRKRLFLYPPEAPYLDPVEYEDRIVDLTNDDLPYDSRFENGVQTFDMEPGDMVSWPLHSPHRVENLEGLNVSVTMEYSSWRSAIINGAYAANGVLRRRFGLSPLNPQEAPRALNMAKLLLARAFRAAGMAGKPPLKAA
ncbi:MAG: cupin-like domain-containing protein [Euryhalocaulis sp.]|uniref:cupin-like domain-containing protein n=1 Tax=Euryhalocaulis sp. TaxID=2744307 RepID=UPI00180ED9CF|nr:cupin-like domain-containing protein [Euryhalocaulis sp.]MBA4800774.1 cupin-like domain-containing protein [Euryhalocaulis sp.]